MEIVDYRQLFGGLYSMLLVCSLLSLAYQYYRQRGLLKNNPEYLFLVFNYSLSNIINNFNHPNADFLDDRSSFANLFLTCFYCFFLVGAIQRRFNKINARNSLHLFLIMLSVVIINAVSDCFYKLLSFKLIIFACSISVLFVCSAMYYLVVNLSVRKRKLPREQDVDENLFSYNIETKAIFVLIHVLIIGVRSSNALGIDPELLVRKAMFLEENCFVIFYMMLILALECNNFEVVRKGLSRFTSDTFNK